MQDLMCDARCTQGGIVRQILGAARAFRQIGLCQILDGSWAPTVARQILALCKTPSDSRRGSVHVQGVRQDYSQGFMVELGVHPPAPIRTQFSNFHLHGFPVCRLHEQRMQTALQDCLTPRSP